MQHLLNEQVDDRKPSLHIHHIILYRYARLIPSQLVLARLQFSGSRQKSSATSQHSSSPSTYKRSGSGSFQYQSSTQRWVDMAGTKM